MLIALVLAAMLGDTEVGGSTASLTLPADAVYYDESDAKKVRIGKDYYPPEARKAKASGYAVVECELKPGGKAIRCAVVEESPLGMGFGKATALRVLKKTPGTSPPPPPEVRQRRFTFRWDYDRWEADFKDPITG